MKPVIYRENRLFRIDESVLPPSARTLEVKNSLYLALHTEFAGAEYSDKYKHMTYLQRMNALNEYALQWLLKKGHKPYGS